MRQLSMPVLIIVLPFAKRSVSYRFLVEKSSFVTYGTNRISANGVRTRYLLKSPNIILYFPR